MKHTIDPTAWPWPAATVKAAEVRLLEFREGERWTCVHGNQIVAPAFATREAAEEWQSLFVVAPAAQPDDTVDAIAA